MSQNKTQRRAWLIIAGVVLGAAALLFFSYKHRRNHWPSAMTRRLAELRTNGVPVSLAECDRRYRALGSTPAAVQHYQKAFAAMPQGSLPLLPRTMQAQQVRPSLPRFSEMAAPAQQAAVASCLQSNRAALQLLHEGLAFDRCLFPMDLTNGWYTLLPHLPKIQRAAHLLLLESLDHQYRGDTEQAGQSLLAALHLAAILRDEPTLIGVMERDRILASACLGLGECLSLAPLPAQDLKLMDERLQGAFPADQRSVCGALDYERSTTLAVFQGSNQEVCEFLQMGNGLWPRLNIEMFRAKGRLQRDAAYYLEQLDRMEAATTNATPQAVLAALADISSEVEQNRHLPIVGKDPRNIISGALLPGTIRGVQRHIWVQTFVETARTALAVEQFRQETGRLPGSLQALVPRYLANVPESPYTGEPFEFRTVPKGYVISGADSVDAPGAGAEGKSRAETEACMFRVERR